MQRPELPIDVKESYSKRLSGLLRHDAKIEKLPDNFVRLDDVLDKMRIPVDYIEQVVAWSKKDFEPRFELVEDGPVRYIRARHKNSRHGGGIGGVGGYGATPRTVATTPGRSPYRGGGGFAPSEEPYETCPFSYVDQLEVLENGEWRPAKMTGILEQGYMEVKYENSTKARVAWKDARKRQGAIPTPARAPAHGPTAPPAPYVDPPPIPPGNQPGRRAPENQLLNPFDVEAHLPRPPPAPIPAGAHLLGPGAVLPAPPPLPERQTSAVPAGACGAPPPLPGMGLSSARMPFAEAAPLDSVSSVPTALSTPREGASPQQPQYAQPPNLYFQQQPQLQPRPQIQQQPQPKPAPYSAPRPQAKAPPPALFPDGQQQHQQQQQQ
mmetsp:Transcript_21884/g.47749  ORF Transcript_21884/g.47749 Transcript_21884/m.47749 type:complete len:380 (-) Transcript_21884:263-1402(-)